MIPYVMQSMEALLDGSTPEQKIIWEQIRLFAGEYATAQRFYFCNDLAGSELTITGRKIYFWYQLQWFPLDAPSITNGGGMTCVDINSNTFEIVNDVMIWQPVAAQLQFKINFIQLNNIALVTMVDLDVAGVVHGIGFKITY